MVLIPMINIKPSIFIVSLVVALVTGVGAGASIIYIVNKPVVIECEKPQPTSNRETFRQAPVLNTGRDKGY